ncbi:hypothetical protein An08g05090 [Aspergillus niger]|uniref:Uncharacterized protein n=2 Tax=Aspergillus niger TaxID=5061 RepID=A2QR80_ASPNC|nr:hypothetical protein An08g05090 [Aspergillus niger]CAK45481.1 hypothetical protein An08g05090 [Aspergillus niger]
MPRCPWGAIAPAVRRVKWPAISRSRGSRSSRSRSVAARILLPRWGITISGMSIISLLQWPIVRAPSFGRVNGWRPAPGGRMVQLVCIIEATRLISAEPGIKAGFADIARVLASLGFTGRMVSASGLQGLLELTVGLQRVEVHDRGGASEIRGQLLSGGGNDGSDLLVHTGSARAREKKSGCYQVKSDLPRSQLRDPSSRQSQRSTSTGKYGRMEHWTPEPARQWINKETGRVNQSDGDSQQGSEQTGKPEWGR